MKVSDPFRLNDWAIQDFLMLILAVQLTLLSVTGAALFGQDFPIVRQVIGFVYLTYIPGSIILRIFGVHNRSRIETMLYSVGLSVAFVMLLGLAMNALYPLIGISEPISTMSIVFTVSVAVSFLCTLSYVRDKDFSSNSFIDTKEVLAPATLALCLLPILAVFGTYFMNFLGKNYVLLFLLVLISIIPTIAMFDRFPRKLYPLTIFVIALALLYHRTLISTYITGWDIQTEFYFSNLVEANSCWVSSLSSDVNAMLSIVMLAPILSITCKLSLVWVLKIIYPLLFSLVPLGLYGVFRKQIDEKIAFLSCFFFMSIFTFYDEMPSLARQQIAEIFLVLLMFLIIDKSMDTTKKSALGIIFAFSLVTSHYGLSYVFMFSLTIVWFILLLKKWQQSSKGIVNSPAFVLLYSALALTWYIYVSSSSTFAHVISIGNNIIANISDFLNPNTVEGLNIVMTTRTRSLLYEVTKILYHVVNLLIAVGVFALLLRRTKLKFQREYAMFSTVSFLMLLGGLTVPYLASALNTSRLYQIALLFLAPFCVVGGEKVSSTLSRMLGTSYKINIGFLKVLSVFFAIFFLFSSGFVYEIAEDYPASISLSNSVDFPRFNEKEIRTAEWLKVRANSSIPIYSDAYRGTLLFGIFGQNHYLEGYEEITTPIPHVTYFFLGSENVKNEKVPLITPYGISTVHLQNLTLYARLLSGNKIYDNNGAQAYLISDR